MRVKITAILVGAVVVALSTQAYAKSVPKQTERALYCGYASLLDAKAFAKAKKWSAQKKAWDEGNLNIRFAIARLHWEDFSEVEIANLQAKFAARVEADSAKGRRKFSGAACSADAIMNA